MKTEETQMKPLVIAFAVAALSATTFGAGQAQDTSGGDQPANAAESSVRDACMQDVMQACPDVHDRASFVQCLTSNLSKFSDGCQSAVKSMRSSAPSGQ